MRPCSANKPARFTNDGWWQRAKGDRRKERETAARPGLVFANEKDQGGRGRWEGRELSLDET